MKRAFCCSSSPGSTARTTSTIAPSIAIRRARVGLADALGTGTATVSLDDVEKTDLFFLIGANPASNHPRLMRSLMTIRRRGGQVIVINPVKEVGLVNFHVPSDVRSMLFGSEIASLYVQPHIGGDLALLTGIAKGILERNAVAQEYVDLFTEGFGEFAAEVKETSWERIERGSGVDRATIERIADMYAAAKTAIFGWCMGITHHAHGVGNVQSHHQPRPDARHGRPARVRACCRSAAIPTCKASALWASRRT